MVSKDKTPDKFREFKTCPLWNTCNYVSSPGTKGKIELQTMEIRQFHACGQNTGVTGFPHQSRNLLVGAHSFEGSKYGKQEGEMEETLSLLQETV